jgi:hypothetical protein
VEAVRTGYIVARNKDAAAKWDRYLAKRSGPRAGLRGESLERVMTSLILTHPEFVKGVRRPRSLQPRALWAAESAGKRRAKRPRKTKG